MSFLPRFFGKKTVATVHGLDWEREKWGSKAKAYLKFGERAAVKYPQATIAVSKYLKSYLEEKYHKHVNYIPSAVLDPVAIAPNEIKQWGLEGGDYYLFLARLVPEKGAHFLLEAFKRLKTDKKLVIAGGSSHSDDYMQSLRDMAGERVIFTDYVYGDTVRELYTNAYAYVHPSTVEGMPITLLEAVAFGKCVIASDIPACVEVVTDCGLMFESRNVDDLIRALQQVEDDPAMATRLGELARARGVEEYSYDSIAVKTLQLYQSLLDERIGIECNQE
jgi:glycosyltransferase involved in cell wall biosynthesis